ncbi:hypothetical protein B0T10DRAFT_487628 [Thelonectria olida]|uniref:Uncharacterized protein n=1 Tax=Thelonectria olida TaxID=1576542 RepID=A0A9P8W752_9HYPO|nr:hypothetical protein B0T10DRAFT_487628 [Thelonectria olida]
MSNPISSSKEQEAQAEREAARHEADESHGNAPPPAYEHVDSGSSEAKQAEEGTNTGKSARPTADAPFNFPSDTPLPSYLEASGSSGQLPIAIPQIKPDPTAPLLVAYAPALLRYGIPKDTWLSLLDAVSAFLAAKVTDRALRHAANMGQHVSEGPKDYFKGVYSHAKHVGKDIGASTKRGNILGAAAGVIAGAVTIPVHAAVGAVGTVVGVPMSAVRAATKKPETPRERAEAYFGVVNKDWLNKRGLHAAMLDSQELSRLVGVSVVDKMELRDGKDESVEAKLGALGGHTATLEVESSASTLAVGAKTLWVVLTQVTPTQS